MKDKPTDFRHHLLWALCLLFFSSMLGACNFLNIAEAKKSSHNLANNPPTKKKVLIILNGLWQGKNDFTISMQRLKEGFQSQNLAVLIDVVEEVKTSEKDINQQAADSFQELKDKYDPNDYELILFGHSQ